MVYFLETEIPNNKKVQKSLESVFGIGKNKTKLICKKSGISKNYKASDLFSNQLIIMSQNVIDSNISITNNLKKNQSLILKKLVDIKSIKGLRRIKGLPVRGQRTHTNAKTSRKIKRF